MNSLPDPLENPLNDDELEYHLESILIENHYFKDSVTDSMKETKKMIIDRNLILTGGMAIDGALRLKGEFLYADHILPDYDFFSPNFHKDSYDLALVLSKNHDNVNAIGAMHVSTMKVRVNYIPVADITYAPKCLYETTPTLKFDGMRIVHPHYQMIDQHLSLSLPYANPPWETINFRWAKDMKRYDILNKAYPLPFNKKQIPKPVKNIKLDDLKCCIGGFAALKYWHDYAKKAGRNIPWKPVNGSIILYSNDVFTLKDHIGRKIVKHDTLWYNPILDKEPRKIILSSKTHKVELLDIKGKLISAHHDGMWYANLQVIMTKFLTEWVFYKNKESLYGYEIAQQLVFWGSANYSENTSHLLPSSEIYPGENISEAYRLSRLYFKSNLGEIISERNRPRNAYLDKDKKIIPEEYYQFNPSQSKIFQFDGKKRNLPFEPHMLPK